MESNSETPHTPANDNSPRKQMGRKRIKVITDPVKFRRHQRRKFYRAISKYVLFGLIFLALCIVIWFALHQVGRAPPAE